MRTELSEDAKKARRDYRREWAKRNPDRIREYARRHWEKKAAEIEERNSENEEECM